MENYKEKEQRLKKESEAIWTYEEIMSWYWE